MPLDFSALSNHTALLSPFVTNDSNVSNDTNVSNVSNNSNDSIVYNVANNSILNND